MGGEGKSFHGLGSCNGDRPEVRERLNMMAHVQGRRVRRALAIVRQMPEGANFLDMALAESELTKFNAPRPRRPDLPAAPAGFRAF